MKYLKAKNKILLWGFVALNLLAFWCFLFCQGLDTKTLTIRWEFLTGKTGVTATLIPLLTVVLAGMLGDHLKTVLVFWRSNHPLPGCRAFSNIAASDPRIDLGLMSKHMGPLPTTPQEQNQVWYCLYRKHDGNTIVIESLRVYLLTRDMTALACGFVLFMPAATLLVGASLKIFAAYLAFLILQYVVLSRSASNYGQRFVANVLSEECHAMNQ